MRQSLAALLLFASAGSAAAPPIAYVQAGGNSSDVWLVNPDGSSKVRLYTGPRQATVSNVDVRSGGGQVAFTEQASAQVVKVVSYNESGIVQGVHTIAKAGCLMAIADYHPTNTSLLVAENCGSAGGGSRILVWDGSELTPLLSTTEGTIYQLRWLRDGSGFLWRMGTPVLGQQIRRSELVNPSAYTVVWQVPNNPFISWLDVARTTDAMLVTFAGPPAEVRRVVFDFAGATDQGPLVAGQQGHYSPDDTALLYRFQTQKGYELRVKTSAGTRTIASGHIISADWGK